MTTDVADVVRTCNQCTYHGSRLPAAPMQGHVTANEPAQRIMMDVVHMEECEGHKYLLVLVCVFSRWAMALPLENLKAATITKVLRRNAIPAGLGRPIEFLVDGGAEFKKELEEACQAWGTRWRPHTPHHSNSAGAVERLNQTIEQRVAHFRKKCDCNWLDAIPLALEAYNGSIHKGLSKGSLAFSPAELWLGRKIRFNSDVRPAILDRPTNVQAYGEWVRQHTAAVKEWIQTEDSRYRADMEKAGNSQAIRKMEVGSAAVLHKMPSKKAKNSGEETWDGPYEVVEEGEQPTDYLIKKKGSRTKATWQHIDNLKQQHKKAADEAEPISGKAGIEPAAKSSKLYEVEQILGERGRSRSSKHYLVKYQGYEGCWWQPAKNLNECARVLKRWEMLAPAEKRVLEQQADVQNPDDINLVMDLRLEKQKDAGRLIADICRKLEIGRNQIRALVASPCCETFTKLDHVNVERGCNFRLPFAPYPPRPQDGSAQAAVKGRVAQEHDDMVKNLLDSIMKDRQEGYHYDFCIENPRGLLRHRPYMNSDEWLQLSSRMTVDYCAFDHDYQKPTDFWHSFGEEYQAKGITEDGKCHQKCGKGRYKANGRFAHWKRHAGPTGSGVSGPEQMLQKWQIPHNLCAEVIQEAAKKGNSEQTVVLDLFSGGESYRKAVEAAGYTYVPVDLKTMFERKQKGRVKTACELKRWPDLTALDRTGLNRITELN